MSGDGDKRAGPGGAAFLEAFGPIGRDLAALDWDASPVGRPESWERSLRTMVTALLGSRFSMWMAWGPDLTFFCNEAYRRDTLGVKYPWALGRSAREVWAEIWPEIGPRIEHVLSTGEATWDEALMLFLERSGYVEETYHTFSYSALSGDSGEVSGMLCVVTEDTQRVITERRMSLIRSLSSATVSLNTEDEVLAAVERELSADGRSLPFSLGYLFEPEGRARLAWAANIEAGQRAAPLEIRPGDPDAPWPAEAVAAGTPLVVDLHPARHGALPAGPWPDPPVQAAVVPLASGAAGTSPVGFLVAGLNRFRPNDDAYQSFVQLTAGQVAAALGRARAYDAERQRAEQLAELDAAKTAFFTNVSHELRTPLTLILGPAEDMLTDEEQPLPPDQRERADLIARNAQRLLSLVNNLLDFSRLEARRATGTFRATDLGAETAGLVALFESAAERAGLELRVQAGPLPEPVWVDREMWAKIVSNLLANALKFTFEGSITVRLEPMGHSVELSVADTGVGISLADQEKLFQRFHRVAGARSRTHEGTGIGLALVAELAALHGGEVSVRSEPGRGSTFFVRIPCGPGHLPAEQVASDAASGLVSRSGAVAGVVSEALHWLPDTGPEPSAGVVAADPPQPSSPAGRILVADDNADMRDYVAGLLKGRYSVETAVDGLEALEKARSRPPDLVLSDVMMPKLDGFGLLQALRSDPATTGVPVVFLSARAGEEGTVEGLAAGADDYLVKPFSARELLARVRAHVELDRARRTRDALVRSQELLDQTERIAQLGSWEMDLATRRASVSAEFLRLVGAERQALEAESFTDVIHSLVHPDDFPGFQATVEGSLTSGDPFHAEIRMLRGGTELRVMRVNGEVLTDDEGRPTSLRGSLQDVTEQKEAERELAAASLAREASLQEHRIADELQSALLPAIDIEPDHLEVATFYRAGVEGTQVGGDWYDVIDLGAGRTALVLGDVMGRGVRAAAVMGQLRSAIRAYSRLGLSPGDVLEYLDGVVRDLSEDQIVTCIYAVFDPVDRTLRWANAGHLPPILASGGRAARLEGPAGAPLGTGPLTLSEQSCQLEPGAILALYTDGLVERRNQDLDEGIQRLMTALSSARGHLAGVPVDLVEAVRPDGPDDDVAILLARVPLETVEHLSASMPIEPERSAVSGARDFVTGTLAGWRVPADGIDDAVLAVSELVSNAVVYGRPPIELRLRKAGRDIVVEVFDGSDASPRRLRPTAEDEHGRGLQLVGILSNRWGTRARAEGKCVWCTFAFDGDTGGAEAAPA